MKFARTLAASVCVALATFAHAQTRPISPGDAAPPISIDALTNAPEGVSATWEALGAGTTVIEFWGTWCGPCVAAIPHVNELHAEFAPRGVHFLSVTYEEPAVVEKFSERIQLNTWIGHDMDQGMVRAYGVRGWPTTFVVRDGVVVARTHPNRLTKERLAAIVEGKPDPSPEAPPPAPGEKGADGRPVVEGTMHAGLDPYSMIPDERPTMQVIVRKAGLRSAAMTSGHSATMLGSGVGAIVGNLWGVPAYRVEVAPALAEARFDVIYALPQENRESLVPIVRQLVAHGMGVALHEEDRMVDAYELRLAQPLQQDAADGAGPRLKLEAGIPEMGGYSSRNNGYTYHLESMSMSLDDLATNLGSALGAPVVNKSGHEGTYRIELELPLNAKGAAGTLEAAAGLTLVPTRQPVRVLHVEPVGGAEENRN